MDDAYSYGDCTFFLVLRNIFLVVRSLQHISDLLSVLMLFVSSHIYKQRWYYWVD